VDAARGKGGEGIINELSSIISLNNLDRKNKLRVDESVEVNDV
jgi:hypothetical protein